jgi:hypothetical protein
MRRTIRVAILSSLAVLAVWVPAGLAGTGPPASSDGTIEVGPDYNKGEPLPLQVPFSAAVTPEATPAAPAQVGEERVWLGLDDQQAFVYPKEYTLRGVGDHIEVWVASDDDGVSKDLEFPAGDCRNDERVQVTDEQVQHLIGEFDSNIFPKESDVFSTPPGRSGENAVLPDLIGLPADYYVGEGDNIVVLVDNVRDDNFYDASNSQNLSYIAGFFYSVFNEYFDRNVMTIDGFDWIHRTTATPPDEPVPGDNCASKPARPFLYEGVFAHEYQHLLEYYADPDETSWLNEGLSDWAQTLTGYVTPSTPITELGFDSHIQCFLGYLGIQTPANPNPRDGGPENSLTFWQDQGPGEILCDYGAAYSMMELLAGRYGVSLMSALHLGAGNGLAGLQEALDGAGAGTSASQVLHDWAVAAALDAVLDGGASLAGGDPSRYQVPTLDASINWDTEHAYSTAGAPPNGSDYVRLRDGGGYLRGNKVKSIAFDGAETLPPKPIEWTVAPEPPDHAGDPALHSGSGPNFDRAIVREVTVPAADPTLTFETRFDTELGWDFGFVQVSTDGGATYTSLSNADTTSDHDPGAIGLVVQNLPGFTGTSGGGAQAQWIETTFDLTAYAGQTILLSFRYVTDSGVDLPGWWIDDLQVGGEPLSDGTTLDGWQSPTAVVPTPVSGFTVQIVAYSEGAPGKASIFELPLGDGFTASLGRGDVARFLGGHVDVVGAIVTYDEPTETVDRYAPYTLTVNGVTQPGGS